MKPSLLLKSWLAGVYPEVHRCYELEALRYVRAAFNTRTAPVPYAEVLTRAVGLAEGGDK